MVTNNNSVRQRKLIVFTITTSIYEREDWPKKVKYPEVNIKMCKKDLMKQILKYSWDAGKSRRVYHVLGGKDIIIKTFLPKL